MKAKFLFQLCQLRFWSLGYPGGRRLGWWNHTCVKSLPGVAAEVCSKFGGNGPEVCA